MLLNPILERRTPLLKERAMEVGWMSQAGRQPTSVDASIAHQGKVGGATGKPTEMNRSFLPGVTNDM